MPTTTFARKAVQRSCAAFLLGLVLCCLGSFAGNPAYAQDVTPPAAAADQAQVTPPPAGENAPANPPGKTPPAPVAKVDKKNGDGNKGEGDEAKPKSNDWDLETNRLALRIILGVMLAVLLGTIVMLVLTRKQAQATTIPQLPAAFFFWLGMCYAIELLLLAVLYHFAWTGPSPCMLADLLPIGVPWFGAMGAVTISLAGVFFYGDAKWDKNFNYWHLGRPVFGAVLGVVAFFIFILIGITANTIPPFLTKICEPGDTACPLPKDFIIYYVLAFLVGYREETFRELIARVTDLILKPGQTAGDAPVIVFKDETGAQITKLEVPNVAQGVAKTRKVQIANTGKGALKEATVKLALAGVSTHLAFAKTDPFAVNKVLPAGQSVTLEITFTPPAAGNYEAALSVAGKDMSAVVLSLTGSCP